MSPSEQPPSPRLPPTERDSHFTVFIRLPFPRGDFVDPPPVEWDSVKDRALWDIISRASKGREVDWHSLADQFDVTLPFLLQQAAWLYERQLSQVRAQLRKVNKPASVGSSPTPGSTSGSAMVGGQAMTRVGSGGQRVLSSLSNRPKERPASRGEGSALEVHPSARVQQTSRNSSTSTVSRIAKQSPSMTQRSPHETQSNFPLTIKAREGHRRSFDVSPKQRPASLARPRTPSPTASLPSSSSSSDSDTPAPPLSQSRAFPRRPRYSAPKAPLGPLSDADEEDEDSPPFLPFSANKPIEQASPPADPSATLRLSPHPTSSHQPATAPPKTLRPQNPPPNIHSSSSSAQSQPPSRTCGPSHNPLSTLSPRQRRVAREGSEGTPSMGSSFSDLDDASVTQSALEEAVANEMAPGVASRMSSLSQALRSRYL